MASGKVGLGRFIEPVEVLGWVRKILGRSGTFAGKTVIVTAGGTQEPIDPVRVLANRSSGKQGFALAQAALDRGAEVTLIAGPTALTTPVGATRIDVSTAAEMCDSTLDASIKADVLIMAAAVADYRPTNIKGEKIKRQKGVPEIELEPTVDILAEVVKRQKKSGFPKRIIGFAAESEDLLDNARRKLEQKGLDLIVANDINTQDAGFSVDSNRVILLSSTGDEQALELMSKFEVAEKVLDQLGQMLASG